ncbi:hypothetical protein BDA99DRAFT_505581 [Phascolomyces articulosus]|uniref:Uncharacterized protein n=1 Tax=Phascolomyces articulosus TaxID=60185 RepID=A0AAD5K425_9FUNG|nr:hypothetical protein BDA99DRAFT_505581 [Phascolomyces articulosus]
MVLFLVISEDVIILILFHTVFYALNSFVILVKVMYFCLKSLLDFVFHMITKVVIISVVWIILMRLHFPLVFSLHYLHGLLNPFVLYVVCPLPPPLYLPSPTCLIDLGQWNTHLAISGSVPSMVLTPLVNGSFISAYPTLNRLNVVFVVYKPMIPSTSFYSAPKILCLAIGLKTSILC